MFPTTVPVILPVIAVTLQEYVVPAIFDDMVIEGILLLQIVWELGFIIGTGFTVTVVFTEAPVHKPALGVTIYVTVNGVKDEFVRVPEIFNGKVTLDPPIYAVPPVAPGLVELTV